MQYAHARIAGILRNAGEPSRRRPARRARAPRSASSSSGSPSSRVVVAEATERRAPHALPYYAIRVADDFHRFYHDHRVLESEAQAFRLGLVGATRAVIARCLDLVGVEAPERM